MDDYKFYAFSFIGEKGIFMKTPLRLFGAKNWWSNCSLKMTNQNRQLQPPSFVTIFGVWAIFSLPILFYYEMASKADKSDSDKPF